MTDDALHIERVRRALDDLGRRWADGDEPSREVVAESVLSDMYSWHECGDQSSILTAAGWGAALPGLTALPRGLAYQAEFEAWGLLASAELGSFDTEEARRYIAKWERDPEGERARLVTRVRYVLGEELAMQGSFAAAADVLGQVVAISATDQEAAVIRRRALVRLIQLVERLDDPPNDTSLRKIADLAGQIDVSTLSREQPDVRERTALEIDRGLRALLSLGEAEVARTRAVEVVQALNGDDQLREHEALQVARLLCEPAPSEVPLHVAEANLLNDRVAWIAEPTAQALLVLAGAAALLAATLALAAIYGGVFFFIAGGAGLLAVVTGVVLARSALAGLRLVRNGLGALRLAVAAQRDSDRSARQALARACFHGEPLVLYLRGFGSEATATPLYRDERGQIRRAHIVASGKDLHEQELVEQLGRHRLVAIANPAQEPDSEQASRLLLPFVGWERSVAAVLTVTDRVVMDATTLTPGVVEELDLLCSAEATAMTLVLAPAEFEPDVFRGVLELGYGVEFDRVDCSTFDRSVGRFPDVVRWTTPAEATDALARVVADAQNFAEETLAQRAIRRSHIDPLAVTIASTPAPSIDVVPSARHVVWSFMVHELHRWVPLLVADPMKLDARLLRQQSR